MEVFQDYINETIVELPYGEQEVSEGSIEHTGLNHTSHFEVLPAVVSEEEVASILALVDDDGLELDSDPDTVDGMVRPKYSRLSLSLSLAHSPPSLSPPLQAGEARAQLPNLVARTMLAVHTFSWRPLSATDEFAF